MKLTDLFKKKPAGEAEARRRRSIEILKRRKVPYMEGLPVLESSAEIVIRDAGTVARRFICSLLVIQNACDRLNDTDVEESRAFVLAMLGKFGLQDEPTERERQVLNGELEQIDLIQVVWQYEADWVLLWALGLADELNYPEAVCDCDAVIEAVRKHDGFAGFMSQVKLRSPSEILDETDLAFRYHWACEEARIHGQNAPAGLDAGVVMERHKALNWLVGYADDWDNMRADT